MAKTIPMVITNDTILIKDAQSENFINYDMPGLEDEPNIPFYHQFAKKISECQYNFKTFMKKLYGNKVTKYVLAIIVPDDTSALEKIFINEFFVNSGACKAVAQMTMGQALSKDHNRYISVSRTSRNVVLQYINDEEIMAIKFYNTNNYNPIQIIEDAKRLHIDVEYGDVPIYVNNLNLNMDEFTEMGTVISTKDFLDKISNITTEKA